MVTRYLYAYCTLEILGTSCVKCMKGTITFMPTLTTVWCVHFSNLFSDMLKPFYSFQFIAVDKWP